MRQERRYICFDSIINHIDNYKCLSNSIDCIVGIARGGVIPATMFAYKLNIKEIYFTQLSSYDKDNKQTTLYEKVPLSVSHIIDKRVLFVDDIADTGHTLNHIKDFYSRYTKDSKFYTCVYKQKSTFKPDFYGEIVDDDTWVEFPWEI